MSGRPNTPGGLEGMVLGPSAISLPEGTSGRLWYRGYDAAELATHLPYSSIAYLLIWGEPPPSDPATPVEEGLDAGEKLAQRAFPLLDRIDPRTSPLDALRTGLSALGDGSIRYPPTRDQGLALAGALPEILAYHIRRAPGDADRPMHRRSSHLARYLERLLGRRPTPAQAHALEVYGGLLADHGMNPSTFALRVVLSTRSDIVSGFVAALGALKGPAHGGAPAEVSAMLDEIGTEERIIPFLEEKLRDGGRLPGFGHRTYRVEDPRSVVLHRVARTVADPRRLALAEATERRAHELLAKLRPGRPLWPNVDYYGSLVLEGVGLTATLFTPTFAIARCAGWTAHALEQSERNRLIQPEFEYDGPAPPRTWPRPLAGPAP
jgi:citrate synthase